MGLKYISEFKCVDGLDARIEIDIVDYVGDPIEVRASNGNAVVINYNGGTDDPHTRRISSSAQINLVQTDNIPIDILEIQGLGTKDGKVRVYENNVLKWTGYIAPVGLQNMFTETPYIFSIAAVDGLMLLDDIDYNGIKYTSTSYASRAPLNYIRDILHHFTGLELQIPINWSVEGIECDVFPGENVIAGSVEWGASGYGYTDAQGNYKKSGWILENILASFDCHIYQSKGEWFIRRIPDIVTGIYTIKRMEFTTGDPVITSSEVDVNADISREGYILINDNSVLTLKPGLGKVTTIYDGSTRDNVLFNGSFDQTLLGNIFGWSVYPTTSGASILPYSPAINGREGYSADVTYPVDGVIDARAYLTLSGEATNPSGAGAGLPIDMNVLYKKMKFGFTFMPLNGYSYYKTAGLDPNGQYRQNGEIDWSDKPLWIRLSTFIQEGGVVREYCLSQYGYWYRVQTGGDFNRYNYTSYAVDPSTLAIDSYFNGSPIVGDYIRREDDGNEIFTSYVPRNMSNNLVAYLNFAGQQMVDRTDATSFEVIPDGTNGYILRILRPNSGTNVGMTWGLSDFIRNGAINITVPGMKIGDIASINFDQGGDILLPKTEESTDSRVGKIYYRLYVREGQRVIFDDVYINVDENNEKVDAVTLDGNNTGEEEYTISISSGKTGFLYSSYFTEFYNANTEYKFTDQFTDSDNLTACLARSILSFRYKSSIIFNGDISVDGKAWNFGEIYNIISLDDKKFLPLSASYNMQMREVTGLVAIECRADNISMSDKHYGSEEQLSN